MDISFGKDAQTSKVLSNLSKHVFLKVMIMMCFDHRVMGYKSTQTLSHLRLPAIVIPVKALEMLTDKTCYSSTSPPNLTLSPQVIGELFRRQNWQFGDTSETVAV